MTTWALTRLNILVMIVFAVSACNSSLKVKTSAATPTENPGDENPEEDNITDGEDETPSPDTVVDDTTVSAAKLADPNCLDPDLSEIKAGVQITLCDGTVAVGTFVVPVMPSFCAADGESDCVVSGPEYKAAKLSNFTGADVKSGVTIAGVGGSATLEFHSNCAADGGTGCVATATYAAALTTDLATKVVFGNTVAGVAGNVTLPAVGDVESGVNYGVNGAGSTGTFAVPAQANVASGINYGAGGTEFAGSAGIEAHTDCAADGGTGCVATATYKAALTTGLASKVVSGNTVAGVPGSATAESHSSCTAANQSGCVATTTYKTMDLATAGAGTGLTNANFNTTIKTAGNFEFWDAAGAKHTVAGDTDLAAANIASTIDIFGTTGSATLESHNSCTADNQTGCITTATYRSADTTAIATSDLKSGKTIAGIAGALANCAADGEAGCVVVGPAYKAADTTLAVAGNIKSGVTIAGTAGTYGPACSADGGGSCLVDGTTYKAAQLSNFTAADIKSGVTIAGVGGSATLESHSNCAADGGTGCVATATYTAALTTSLGDKVLFGQTVAGVAGNVTLPAVTDVESGVNYGIGGTGSSGTFAVPAQANVASGISYGAGGTEFSGSATIESHSNCAADGGTGCVATATYTAALTTGLAAKVVSGNTVAGVPGSATAESHSSCATDGEAGCVVVGPAFKAADTTLAVAGNIKSGVTIGGALGTYGPACSADGGGSCLVDGTTYKAAKLSNFTGADVKSGVTIAGVGGSATLESHSDCAADGGTGCVATATYTAALTTSLGDKVLSGQTVAGVAGNVTLPAVTDVESGVNYGIGGTGLSGTFAVPAQANVASGVNYGAGGTEFSGSATIESHSNCAADGGTGCVATATYTAALTTGLAAKVVSGNTVAGVPGSATAESHSSCTAANQSGCVATTTYKTMDLATAGAGTGITNANFNATIKTAGNFEFWDAAGAKHTVAGDTDLAAANIASTIDIFGTTGSATLESHSNCAADGGTGCVATATYTAALTTGLAAKVVSGNTVAGISGSATAESHSNCAADGESGCVVVGPAFKAADTTVAIAGNIKSGVTIAGVTGQYPSATYTLPGASVTTDLTSMAGTTAAGTYEFWDSAGARYTGTITDASTITPGTSDQTFNTSLYRQFTVSGDADLVAAKIKSGVTLFGVNGDYPSATNPLTGADATADLDLATFDAKIKSGSSFEWFDAYGSRYTNTGDADITAANIVSGVTIFGTSGSAVTGSACTGDGQTGCVTTATYKSADTSAYTAWDIRRGKTVGGIAGEITFFKNMANTTLFDRTTGDGAISGLDIYDTIDDYNNNNGTSPYIPTQNNTGWDQATGANWVMDSTNDNGTGGGTASNGACDGGEACVFTDRLTNLMWAKADATTRNWETGITYCEGLSYGSYTDWRLPTQKELMQAYTDGIWSQKASTKLNLSNTYYWSSSTVSLGTTGAWVVSPLYGYTGNSGKTTAYRVVCVR